MGRTSLDLSCCSISSIFSRSTLKWDLYTMLAASQNTKIVVGQFSSALKWPTPCRSGRAAFVDFETCAKLWRNENGIIQHQMHVLKFECQQRKMCTEQ